MLNGNGMINENISKCRDALNAGAEGFTMYTVAMTSRYAGRETQETKSKAAAVKLPHLLHSKQIGVEVRAHGQWHFAM
jgi:hypothetical protein